MTARSICSDLGVIRLPGKFSAGKTVASQPLVYRARANLRRLGDMDDSAMGDNGLER